MFHAQKGLIILFKIILTFQNDLPWAIWQLSSLHKFIHWGVSEVKHIPLGYKPSTSASYFCNYMQEYYIHIMVVTNICTVIRKPKRCCHGYATKFSKRHFYETCGFLYGNWQHSVTKNTFICFKKCIYSVTTQYFLSSFFIPCLQS